MGIKGDMEMRKLIVILAIVALVGGCCAGTNSAGKATKNPWNCVTNNLPKAQAILCSPTVLQVEDAILALQFLDAYPAAKVGVATAIAVFEAIRSRICVSIPQLQQALADFDNFAATVQGQAPAQMKAGVALAPPALASLRAVVK